MSTPNLTLVTRKQKAFALLLDCAEMLEKEMCHHSSCELLQHQHHDSDLETVIDDIRTARQWLIEETD